MAVVGDLLFTLRLSPLEGLEISKFSRASTMAKSWGFGKMMISSSNKSEVDSSMFKAVLAHSWTITISPGFKPKASTSSRWYWFNSDAVSKFVIGETYTVEIDGKSTCATLVVGQC